MSKVDDLKARFGGNVAESMGANRTSRSGAGGIRLATPDPFEGTERFGNARMIEVARIDPDPDQPRTDFDPTELEQLAASLTEHGQLQPIVVRPGVESGRFVIVAGERRHRASIIARRSTIAAVLMTELDPAKVFEMQLVENALRSDLKPVEQGRAFRRLMDQNGWSALKLGDTLKISESKVIRALALLDLPCTVQDMVESSQIAPSVAYELAKVNDPIAAEQIAHRVVNEGLTREQTIEARQEAKVNRTLSKGKGKGATIKGKPKLRESWPFTAGPGFKIVATCKKGIAPVMLVEALERFAVEARAKLVEQPDPRPAD